MAKLGRMLRRKFHGFLYASRNQCLLNTGKWSNTVLAALNFKAANAPLVSLKQYMSHPSQPSVICITEIAEVLQDCLDEYWADRFNELTIDSPARMYAALQPFIRYQSSRCPLADDDQSDPTALRQP